MPTLDVEEEQQERRDLGSMSLLQHLEELRKRLINSVIAVAVGFFVAFWYHDQIYAWMSKPLKEALSSCIRTRPSSTPIPRSPSISI